MALSEVLGTIVDLREEDGHLVVSATLTPAGERFFASQNEAAAAAEERMLARIIESRKAREVAVRARAASAIRASVERP